MKSRKDARKRRHERKKAKVRGTAERPRFSIMLSNRHASLQFVDDEKGVTLASISTYGHRGIFNVKTAEDLGKKAADAAAGKGIKNVVIDRGGHKFHGRVKAIVDSMRASGVKTGNAAREEQ